MKCVGRCLVRQALRCGVSSDRHFGYWIEEMQAFGLNRKPNRFTNPERDLRVDTRDGYPSISDACFKDDFRTQLLNHFDAGVEAALRNVATERKMFGPHTHQYLFAPPASQRPIAELRQS